MHGFLQTANIAFAVVPRIGDGDVKLKQECEFDMVFCFGICMPPYAVVFFFAWIYLQHITRPVESDRPINIVFVHLFALP